MTEDLKLLVAFLLPIKDLLLDDHVSEIMGNPDGKWWCERAGRLEPVEVEFAAKALATGLEVIANKLNRRLDNSCPLLNVQLPDGSRLAAVIPPVVRPFPALTIRKFPKTWLSLEDLLDRNLCSRQMGEALTQFVEQGKTILISGGTGSGKTTLLNALADYIPDRERIVVIEDTTELRIGKPNVLASECQTHNPEIGVDFNDLLKAALRWRPDRIILGEVRGSEARTLLDSMNTGHAGTIATIHASSSVRALRRFSELAMRSHSQANRDDISAEIAESVEVVIQVSRTAEGRRVTEAVTVSGYRRPTGSFIVEPVLM
jgi:pilus assembly protein CpaF